MTATFNVAAAWINRAASATITSTTAATAMPVSLLQQEDTRRVWRGAGGAGVLESVFFDLGAVQSDINQVSLIYTNLAAVDATRCRLSVADPTCVTNTYDSTSIAGRVDPDYKSLHFLTTPASSPRYGRIDLTRAAGSPEAGFLHAGPYTTLSYNYDYGAQFTIIDPSDHKTTRGGQTKIVSKPIFRACDLTVGTLTEAQRYSVFQAIGLANGISSPILLMLNPASTNMGRDTIYGLLQDSIPVTAIQGFDGSGNSMYAASIKLHERL